LGTMLAIACLWAMRRGAAAPAQVALLLSAFGLDAGLTLAKRIVQGRRFWRAHREHLYQMAVRKGHSHAGVCMAYAGWAILCAAMALALRGAGVRRHRSNAPWAALTAAFMSSLVERGKRPTTSRVSAGLTFSNISPDSLGTHSPLM